MALKRRFGDLMVTPQKGPVPDWTLDIILTADEEASISALHKTVNYEQRVMKYFDSLTNSEIKKAYGLSREEANALIPGVASNALLIIEGDDSLHESVIKSAASEVFEQYLSKKKGLASRES